MQQSSRLRAHALPVRQVTCILIGHALVHRSKRSIYLNARQELADVLHSIREIARAHRVVGIVLQQDVVFLQRSAAPSRIADDYVQIVRPKCVNVASSEVFRRFTSPGVDAQRATATLRLGDHDLTPIAREHTYRCPIRFAKEIRHDTARYESHTPFGLAARGHYFHFLRAVELIG